MITLNHCKQCLAGLGLLLVAGTAAAQWELDNAASSLNFISIKNGAVAETHGFDSLMGYVGADGAVQLGIDLDSVNTAIEIRDQRMREKLFETGSFATANISAQVDPAIIDALQPGTVVSADVGLSLSLHGVKTELNAPVVVISEAGGLLRVLSARPVIVSASAFGLDEGIAQLRSIAGLESIATAVPVTFHLVFTPAAEGT